MLRVALLTVDPVRPTCSTYLRQLCRLPAIHAGATYIHRKYFQTPTAVTAHNTPVQVAAMSANSHQIRRRTFLLRIGEFSRRNDLTKTSGVTRRPQDSSSTA